MEAFDKFWSAWPRKLGKKAARKIWDRDKLDDQISEILVAVERQTRYMWQGKDAKYIPHATTWLNGARWEDVIEVPEEQPIRGQMIPRTALEKTADRIQAQRDADAEEDAARVEKLTPRDRMINLTYLKMTIAAGGYRYLDDDMSIIDRNLVNALQTCRDRVFNDMDQLTEAERAEAGFDLEHIRDSIRSQWGNIINRRRAQLKENGFVPLF